MYFKRFGSHSLALDRILLFMYVSHRHDRKMRRCDRVGGLIERIFKKVFCKNALIFKNSFLISDIKLRNVMHVYCEIINNFPQI